VADCFCVGVSASHGQVQALFSVWGMVEVLSQERTFVLLLFFGLHARSNRHGFHQIQLSSRSATPEPWRVFSIQALTPLPSKAPLEQAPAPTITRNEVAVVPPLMRVLSSSEHARGPAGKAASTTTRTVVEEGMDGTFIVTCTTTTVMRVQ
jgi:hypothetical protein